MTDEPTKKNPPTIADVADMDNEVFWLLLPAMVDLDKVQKDLIVRHVTGEFYSIEEQHLYRLVVIILIKAGYFPMDQYSVPSTRPDQRVDPDDFKEHDNREDPEESLQ